jgi:hypothetical protein
MKFSPAQAIHMLLKIPATRTPQGVLKFVALIIKILSCNKNLFFHGLRSKLPQLFYFSSFKIVRDRTDLNLLIWDHDFRFCQLAVFCHQIECLIERYTSVYQLAETFRL